MDRTDYLGFRKNEIRYVKFHQNRTFWEKLFSRVLAALEWAGGIWGEDKLSKRTMVHLDLPGLFGRSVSRLSSRLGGRGALRGSLKGRHLPNGPWSVWIFSVFLRALWYGYTTAQLHNRAAPIPPQCWINLDSTSLVGSSGILHPQCRIKLDPTSSV